MPRGIKQETVSVRGRHEDELSDDKKYNRIPVYLADDEDLAVRHAVVDARTRQSDFLARAALDWVLRIRQGDSLPTREELRERLFGPPSSDSEKP